MAGRCTGTALPVLPAAAPQGPAAGLVSCHLADARAAAAAPLPTTP